MVPPRDPVERRGSRASASFATSAAHDADTDAIRCSFSR
jgi:hypothetical protein